MTDAPPSRNDAAPSPTAGSAPGYDGLLANVLANLHKNGYPDRQVSLPLERLYEAAYKQGLNFNKALEMLKARGVDHTKATTKIIFFPVKAAADADGAVPPGMAEMMAKASAMLQDMPPEQLAQLQRMVAGMTDEERQEVMDKAKALGLGS